MHRKTFCFVDGQSQWKKEIANVHIRQVSSQAVPCNTLTIAGSVDTSSNISLEVGVQP